MAYAATVTHEQITLAGENYHKLTIDEVEAANSSEWSASVPSLCTMTYHSCRKVSGAGSTVDPELGLAAGLAGPFDPIFANGAAAAAVVSRSDLRIVGGTLYGRSKINSGTDNVLQTIIILRRGHG